MTEYIPGEQPGGGGGIIKLNTNENPFPASQRVLDRIKEACNQSLRLYPNSTSLSLRKIFAKDNNIDSDNIFVGNGSDEIFTLIFRAFIENNGVVAFSYPSYSLYYTMAEANGIKYKKINLDKDFNVDLDAFLSKNYDLVILCNPNNPTGKGCDVDDIRRFLDKYKGLLIVDEAYVDFYGETSIEMVKEFDNIIVTRSFSKSYSLAGLRVGLAIAQKDIIRGFLKIKDSYNVDRLAEAGACAALLDKKGLKYNIDMMKNNKEFLEEKIEALGFQVVPSKANFLFVKHSHVQAVEIYKKLREKKILVRYFDGPIQSEYLRISIGSMMELKTLINGLSSILKD